MKKIFVMLFFIFFIINLSFSLDFTEILKQNIGKEITVQLKNNTSAIMNDFNAIRFNIESVQDGILILSTKKNKVYILISEIASIEIKI